MLRSSPLGKSRLATGGGAITGLGEASWLFHAAVGSPEMLGKSSSGRSVCGSLASLRLLAAVAAAAAAAQDDPLATKLALAEEINAIGDPDGARTLIEEVVAESSGALKTRAQRMLAELG